MRQIVEMMDSHLYAAAIESIAIKRLIVARHGGQTDGDKVKAAVAPVKAALEAIESLTVGHPYLLGHELSIADFHLIPVFT